MNFIKNIFEGKIDESVHFQFQKFSKGEFRNRAIIEGKNSNGKYTLKTSAEFANELVKIVAEKRFLGKFYYLCDEFEDLYTVKVRSKHPFLYSFSYITITNYPIAQLFTRMNNYSQYFFLMLLIDFDKYNLHHRYNYRSKIDKSKLRIDLMNHTINDNVIQFIADYYDIHIIINDMLIP